MKLPAKLRLAALVALVAALGVAGSVAATASAADGKTFVMLQDDIAPGLEGTDRLGLPAVGEDEFLKAGESVGQHGNERARARRRVKPWPGFLAEIFAWRSAADDQAREHRRGVAHPLARMRGAVVF